MTSALRCDMAVVQRREWQKSGSERGRLQSCGCHSFAAHSSLNSKGRNTNEVETCVSRQLLELHNGGGAWVRDAHLEELDQPQGDGHYFWRPQYLAWSRVTEVTRKPLNPWLPTETQGFLLHWHARQALTESRRLALRRRLLLHSSCITPLQGLGLLPPRCP